ncbi:hypothetical protein B0H13DRAFT_2305294 [Mycena leptocephala]|nr:hypothetical protein B0H13DRAFT_2305294 [Mycena leptocephala]
MGNCGRQWENKMFALGLTTKQLNTIIFYLILSYDIACQYGKNFWTRTPCPPYALRFFLAHQPLSRPSHFLDCYSLGLPHPRPLALFPYPRHLPRALGLPHFLDVPWWVYLTIAIPQSAP